MGSMSTGGPPSQGGDNNQSAPSAPAKTSQGTTTEQFQAFRN